MLAVCHKAREMMKQEDDRDTNHNWSTRKKLEQKIRDPKKNLDCADPSSSEISLKILKRPGELKRCAVTQTSVKTTS